MSSIGISFRCSLLWLILYAGCEQEEPRLWTSGWYMEPWLHCLRDAYSPVSLLPLRKCKHELHIFVFIKFWLVKHALQWLWFCNLLLVWYLLLVKSGQVWTVIAEMVFVLPDEGLFLNPADLIHAKCKLPIIVLKFDC